MLAAGRPVNPGIDVSVESSAAFGGGAGGGFGHPSSSCQLQPRWPGSGHRYTPVAQGAAAGIGGDPAVLPGGDCPPADGLSAAWDGPPLRTGSSVDAEGSVPVGAGSPNPSPPGTGPVGAAPAGSLAFAPSGSGGGGRPVESVPGDPAGRSGCVGSIAGGDWDAGGGGGGGGGGGDWVVGGGGGGDDWVGEAGDCVDAEEIGAEGKGASGTVGAVTAMDV